MGRGIRGIRAAAVGIVICVASSACYSYHTSNLAPVDFPQGSLGTKSRITLRDGRVHTMVRGAISGDSVIGNADGTNARLALAVSDVKSIDTWTYNRGRTTRLLAVPAALAVAAYVAILVEFVYAFTHLPPL